MVPGIKRVCLERGGVMERRLSVCYMAILLSPSPPSSGDAPALLSFHMTRPLAKKGLTSPSVLLKAKGKSIKNGTVRSDNYSPANIRRTRVALMMLRSPMKPNVTIAGETERELKYHVW